MFNNDRDDPIHGVNDVDGDGGVGSLVTSQTSFEDKYNCTPEEFTDAFTNSMARHCEEAKSQCQDSYRSRLWDEQFEHFIRSARTEEILGTMLRMQSELLARQGQAELSGDQKAKGSPQQLRFFRDPSHGNTIK